MPQGSSRIDKEYDLYVQRFNSMGLELPEAASANPASMRCVASFLLKNGVFGEDDGLNAAAPEAASTPVQDGEG